MDEADPADNSSHTWKRPDEVMRYYKLKQKKRALNSRINGNDTVTNIFSQNSNSEDSFEFPAAKRRNPFCSRFENKPSVKTNEATDESGVETDISSDASIFLLLNKVEKKSTPGVPRSFANILQHLNVNEKVPSKDTQQSGNLVQENGFVLPVDWSIKTKVRIMSPNSFSWSAVLKTCEEACSITGFVRCLDSGDGRRFHNKNSQLDVTTNAKLHQYCLYWLHPNLPWLSLFPRNMNQKVNPQLLASQLLMSQSLITEWASAFKSLYQLVRVNKCPYFYVIANHYHCIFRAAGMAGIPEVHALISPTTRGFRKLLDDEGVEYVMPLKKKRLSGDLSNDSVDVSIPENEELSGDEDWLESLAVDAQQIKKYTNSQKSIDRAKERRIDGSDESLVLVQGMEVQSFFNVLVNCKSSVAVNGPYAGVPPTLLAPTAFLHGSLKSCKVRNTMVHVEGSLFHSIQVDGPVLPHSFRQICTLLKEEEVKCSVSASSIKQTLGFTHTSKKILSTEESKKTSTVFCLENLVDCGLPESVMSFFCNSNPEMYDVIESIKLPTR